ncbi:hypothetical protein RRF57_007986 [Xylaria bambusicola]|uniref:Uncharacterized protein n=1 Tax=Xylaria bambusicola TaxID=326684 RepID=A0AAN7Z7W7_9PEZI
MVPDHHPRDKHNERSGTEFPHGREKLLRNNRRTKPAFDGIPACPANFVVLSAIRMCRGMGEQVYSTSYHGSLAC